MKRMVVAAKEVSEGFADAFDQVDDDTAFALSSIETLSRKNEAAAKDILNEMNGYIQTIISRVAEELA